MDAAVLHAVNPWIAGGSRPLWYLLGRPEAAWAFAGLLLAWIAYTRNWRTIAIAALVVAFVDPLCARVVKPLADRARPCQVDPVVLQIRDIPCGSGSSMPSNHAANTAALAAALGSPPLAVASLFAGTSRVVLGQHWPSDVLAGWAIGAAVGAGVRVLARRGLGWS
ncbi:MAG: phosphatase PAP2 family protein [Myxococcota bacterium]